MASGMKSAFDPGARADLDPELLERPWLSLAAVNENPR